MRWCIKQHRPNNKKAQYLNCALMPSSTIYFIYTYWRISEVLPFLLNLCSLWIFLSFWFSNLCNLRNLWICLLHSSGCPVVQRTHGVHVLCVYCVKCNGSERSGICLMLPLMSKAHSSAPVSISKIRFNPQITQITQIRNYRPIVYVQVILIQNWLRVLF